MKYARFFLTLLILALSVSSAFAQAAPDADGDGFVDTDDRCPNEAGTPGVGRGDCADPDGDFITNDGDLCPNEAGPAETGGCPFTATPAPEEPTPEPTAPALSTRLPRTGDCVLTPSGSTPINIRQQPFADAEIVGQLNPGEQRAVVGDFSFGQSRWYAIGDDQWVSGDVVQLGGLCSLIAELDTLIACTQVPGAAPQRCGDVTPGESEEMVIRLTDILITSLSDFNRNTGADLDLAGLQQGMMGPGDLLSGQPQPPQGPPPTAPDSCGGSFYGWTVVVLPGSPYTGPADLLDTDTTFKGTPCPELIYGTNGDDNIQGEGGLDILVGFGGNDTLYGGEGSDIIFGGDGDDRILLEFSPGSTGSDLAFGGAGNDIIMGIGGWVPIVYGDNPLLYSAVQSVTGVAPNSVQLNNGFVIEILGADEYARATAADFGSDMIIVRAASAWIYGGGGNDTLVGGDYGDFLFGGEGFDYANGNDGIDLCSGADFVDNCEDY